MGAGVGGRIDQSATEIHVPIMVGADLGDDVGGVPVADGRASEHDGIHVTSFPVVQRCRSSGLATHDHHRDGELSSLMARR